MDSINKNLKAIQELCAKHKVAKLFVFGSILTPKFSEQSDVDLLVDFQKIDIMSYADNYFNFKNALENIFKRKVYLLENQSVKNTFLRASIDESKIKVHG